MKDGIIQQIDTPQNLYNNPNNLFVAGFIGSPPMNFINAVVKKLGEAVTLGIFDYNIRLNELQSNMLIENGYNGKEVIIGIRPENLSICEPPNNLNINILEASIEISESLGAETLLHLNIEGVNVIARANPQSSYKHGEKVKLSIKSDRIHVFDKVTETVIL